jgi:hypothetical protein
MRYRRAWQPGGTYFFIVNLSVPSRPGPIDDALGFASLTPTYVDTNPLGATAQYNTVHHRRQKAMADSMS